MRHTIIFLAFFFSLLCIGQSKEWKSELLGIYVSRDNKFEKWSIVELRENGKFVYKYGLSACQGEVAGTYTFEENTIRFKNDAEFVNKMREEFSPIYPDMSLTKWKVTKKFIKPKNVIDSGCIKTNRKHYKQ
jgi:hypothetical protein